jgi:ligand-binding SRPBCC domain-containing protein
MKMIIRSEVKCGFEKVSADFGSDLFRFLLPPKYIATLVEYQGSKPGSKVHIRFKFPFPSDWISIIKSEEKDAGKYVFMDEGEKLPFGLTSWKHIHRVIKIDEIHTEIIDDMSFSTGHRIFDFLLFPVLFLSFYPRKRLYKQYFEK